jgi:Tripartite tricarboxylate transporter TctB family
MMRIFDQLGSLFWLFMAIYVCIESLRLGTGTPRSPGMGFMTFGASVVLGFFSLIVFIQTFFKKEESNPQAPFSGVLWTRVVFVTIALLIYSQLMPVLGYLISTFLMMSFLFGIVKKMKWWWVFISSFLTTLGTYYLFSKCLNCQFPDGLFRL